MLKSEVKTVEFELADLELKLIYGVSSLSVFVVNDSHEFRVLSKSELENLIKILTEAKEWIEKQ